MHTYSELIYLFDFNPPNPREPLGGLQKFCSLQHNSEPKHIYLDAVLAFGELGSDSDTQKKAHSTVLLKVTGK